MLHKIRKTCVWFLRARLPTEALEFIGSCFLSRIVNVDNLLVYIAHIRIVRLLGFVGLQVSFRESLHLRCVLRSTTARGSRFLCE